MCRIDHGYGATHPGVGSRLAFRRCMNPHRGIAGSQNADDRLRLLSGSSWSMSATSQVDASETGLVADVELHPGASATH
jgi:hypothetical protein